MVPLSCPSPASMSSAFLRISAIWNSGVNSMTFSVGELILSSYRSTSPGRTPTWVAF